MKLSEKIILAAEALGPKKQELDGLRTELKQLTDQLGDGDNADEVLIQMESLTDSIEALAPKVEADQKNLDMMIKAEKSLIKRAAPVAPAVINSTPDYNGNAGSLMAKEALVAALSHIQQTSPNEILATRFKEDKHLQAIMQSKAAVGVADTVTATWAAELVRNDMRGFLDMLKTRSIGAGLAAVSTQIDFAGAGSVTIPRINDIPTNQTEPAWVGEGGVIPLQRFTMGSAKLSRFKLASIVPLTMELAEVSTPAAVGIFENAMQEAYIRMLDKAIMSGGAAVPDVRPAGLMSGVTAVAGDATGGYVSVIADLRTLRTALTVAGLGEKPVLILNDQDFDAVGLLLNPLGQLPFQGDVASGQLVGIPVLHSRNAVKGTAMLVDAAALATAFDGPDFRISQEATLTMADAGAAAPSQADNGGGLLAGGTPGEVQPDAGIHVGGADPSGAITAATAGVNSQAVSMFQTYSEAIRGIWPTSWAVLRPGAVVAVNTLKW